jgi:5-methylthioadenosine/S-adenosylhomocysteine deaminase
VSACGWPLRPVDPARRLGCDNAAMTDQRLSESQVPEPCDLLIEARYVVPVEPHAVVLDHHAVAVRDGLILAVLPIADAQAKFAPKETVSRPESVLIPGLINAHCHNPMTLMRGVADDLPLKQWLQEHIWPIEGAVIGPDFFPDVQAATYKRYGFRAMVGLPVIDFPTAWAKSDDEYFDRAGEVHDQWRDDALITTAFAPHAPYTVSDDNFERIRMLADQLDLPVHLHTHETAQEVQQSQQKHNQRPLARLDRLGLVNDRLIAVHMTQLTDAEIALCAERGVSVVHCPESNLKLASGFCPVAALERAGVTVAIGTDGCASNNDLDMFGEMRTAALLAKAVADDAAAFDAASALRATTLGSAKAMGLDHLVGSITSHKQADLTCVDLSALETQPLYHVLSQLVYATGRHQVTDVWVAGKAKLRDRILVDMDIDALTANARQWRVRISGVRA